jgi:hypothetical protein
MALSFSYHPNEKAIQRDFNAGRLTRPALDTD